MLLKTREQTDTFVRQSNYIFEPHAAETRIVKAWFDGEHLTALENGFLKPREFVNFQTETVTGAVKESDLPPFAQLGRITTIAEKLFDLVV